MFGLTKLEITLALCLAIMLGVFGVYWYGHHQGVVADTAADAKVESKTVVHNSKVEAAGTIANAAEDARREKLLTAPIAPAPSTGGLQLANPPSACPVPNARPAAGASQHAAPVRATDAPGVVPQTWDSFIESDVQRARAADIEIDDRNTLLRQHDAVCRGQVLKPGGPL